MSDGNSQGSEAPPAGTNIVAATPGGAFHDSIPLVAGTADVCFLINSSKTNTELHFQYPDSGYRSYVESLMSVHTYVKLELQHCM